MWPRASIRMHKICAHQAHLHLMHCCMVEWAIPDSEKDWLHCT